MANPYFQFKQFRIDQGYCAMKVTTDACIQGAWTPVLPHVTNILDIGAGTGLLSLMLAQRTPHATIHAVEIDKDCAEQARLNFEESSWKDQLTLFNADARDNTSTIKYDLIIANPPFFNNSLLGPESARNTARHTLTLTYHDLILAITNNLAPQGYASVLLPCPEYDLFKGMLKDHNLHECGRLSIRHSANADVKRVVCLISRDIQNIWENEELIIKDERQQYTTGFTSLLAPFYLYL